MTELNPEQYWFVLQNNHLLFKKNIQTPELLTNREIIFLEENFLRKYQIGNLLQRKLHCAELAADYLLPNEIIAIPLKKSLEIINAPWRYFAIKAHAVINWDKNHQFCGHCGGKTVARTTLFERVCSACLLSFFPRISPSIIVRITRGDEILMARGHEFTPGAYGLIAGFIEAGETIEEALHREVKEEVGIQIKNVNYYGSQAWPFPDSLVIAFTAEYESGELVVDSTELEVAGWYRYDNLPGKPSTSISIARQLIDDFVKEMNDGKL